MMKPWPDCQDTRPDDMEFCPRDGAPPSPAAALYDRRSALTERRYNSWRSA
jgi:hypothetical protein